MARTGSTAWPGRCGRVARGPGKQPLLVLLPLVLLRVARAMGAELGWGAARIELEARRFDEEARAEYMPADG